MADFNGMPMARPAQIDQAVVTATADRRSRAAAASVATIEAFWGDFDAIIAHAETDVAAERLSPATIARHRADEERIRTFAVNYHARRGGSITIAQAIVKEALGPDYDGRPPIASRKVLDDVFWKTYVRFMSFRQQTLAGTATHVMRSTLQDRTLRLFACAHRITGVQLERPLRKELLDMVASLKLDEAPKHRIKKICTANDVLRLIRDGAFSTKTRRSQPRCARERLQQMASLSVMLLTAARPGEVLVSHAYKRTGVDALRWRDVQFYVRASWPSGSSADTMPTLSLGCDVLIRNLKGGRQDEQVFRIAPLYQDEQMPRALDATVLLAVLAQQDGIFGTGIDILASASTCDAAYFTRSRPYLDVPMLEDRANGFIFRNIVRNTKTSLFEVHPTEALDYSSLAHRTQVDASEAGLIGFHFYAMRRAVANALQNSSVTEHDMRNYIGHRASTATFAGAYQSKRSLIDGQGYVMHGKASEDRFDRGFATFEAGTTLTAAEHVKCDEEASVAAALSHLAEVDAKLVAYTTRNGQSSSGDDVDGTSFDDLRKERAKAEKALSWRRRVVRNQCIVDKRKVMAEREARETISRGAAPHSAHQMTADEVLDSLRSMDDGPESKEAEEEDEELARDTLAFDIAAEMDEAASPSLHDGDNADASLLATETALEEAGNLAPHRPSSSVHLDAALSSTAHASLTDDAHPDDTAVQRLGLKLRESLDALSASINPWLTTACDTSPLFTVPKEGTPGLDLATTAKLLAGEIGTVNHRRFFSCIEDEQLRCPTCDESMLDILTKHGKTPLDHFVACARPAMSAAYDLAVSEALENEQCPSVRCRPNKSSRKRVTAPKLIGTDEREVCAHLATHTGGNRGLYHPLTCQMVNDDGENCTYKNPALTVRRRTEFYVHMETRHGIANRENAVVFCRSHHVWLFGQTQVEAHYAEEHLSVWLKETKLVSKLVDQSTEAWLEGPCAWCACDTTLSPLQRMRTYDNRYRLAGHIVNMHLTAQFEARPQCPVCDEAFALADFCDHLTLRHGMHLAAGAQTVNLLGTDFERLVGIDSTKAARKRFNEWHTEVISHSSADTSMDANDENAEPGTTGTNAAKKHANEEAKETSPYKRRNFGLRSKIRLADPAAALESKADGTQDQAESTIDPALMAIDAPNHS